MRRLSSYGSKLGCQGNPRFDYVWYSNHQFQGSMILIHSYIHRNNSWVHQTLPGALRIASDPNRSSKGKSFNSRGTSGHLGSTTYPARCTSGHLTRYPPGFVASRTHFGPSRQIAAGRTKMVVSWKSHTLLSVYVCIYPYNIYTL